MSSPLPPPQPTPPQPTTRFWLNVAALTAAPTAVGLWLARYTGLLTETGTSWLLTGAVASVVAAVTGVVSKTFRDEWLKAFRDNVTDALSSRPVYRVVLGCLAAAGVVSLGFGGFRMTDPSGAGPPRVAVHPTDGRPPRTWESKSSLYTTRWIGFGGPAQLRVAVEGLPKRNVILTPWFRAGEYELEYPRDFLRPVVLVVAEKYLTDKAEKSPGSLTLVVAVAGTSPTPVPFDGHAVWVGCDATDRVAVPADAARADWPTAADARFDRYVKHPAGHESLSAPLDAGLVVSAVIHEAGVNLDDGRPRPRTRPAEVYTATPPRVGDAVQVLTLYVD